MIKGVTVQLISQIESGVDAFNAPVYTEQTINVENVLIGEPTTQDIVDDLQMYGKRCAYTLAIPKGDTNVWEDQIVEFFGRRWRVYGNVTQGIEDLIPLFWNKKVHVEAFADGSSFLPE